MGADVVEQALSPQVSIIIPCYNSGRYLREALASVSASSDKPQYEVIIVDDGSSEAGTLALLTQLRAEGYTVLQQANQGPAAARNTGVRASRGKYLLFLDSDNKIRPNFLKLGIEAFSQQPAVGVVHGRANFFGESTEARFLARPFDKFAILATNYIDICSMIRKEVWQEVGGLDETRVLIGHEDWEFWIRVSTTAWQFYFVEQTLFDYRVDSQSLVTQANQGERLVAMRRYVYQKHWRLVADAYYVLNLEYQAYQHDKGKPLRSFLKFLYAKVVAPTKN